ncbi:metal ABC transporter permease [Methanoplanus sp. FWC-SCC4]|uniref:Metal ABC transporter permease n=2 Tax=Methanochimaera problematica TaxID=2609417 RepID=A0AA97FD97_9EURY|nr:metal ABC transporter permease [Methanoplanus sp. FWC-SCC4]
MLSVLGYEFFRNALFAGIIASMACGVIGSFVVVKRMVSLSGGISHAAFGGIGLGYFFGFDPIIGATGFSIATAALIGHIRNTAHQHMDTLVGSVWAVGMALGIMFVYLTPGNAPDLFGYLFGNILLVPFNDILIMAFLVALIFLIVFLFYNQILAVTFDEEYADVMNIPSEKIMILLLVLIALTVVMLIQVVGVILVIALLTLPAAIAREFTMKISHMFYISSLLGAVFTTSGIFLSYLLNVPSGATIILLSAVVYITVVAMREAGLNFPAI